MANIPWVVVGGKQDEGAHCTRCGEGMVMGLPQPLYMALAMMKAFTQHHGQCQDNGRNEPVPEDVHEWFRGRDTGISSRTIYSVFMFRKVDRVDIPYDPDDFGRCYRLLKLSQSWRSRLAEVGTKYPAWKPFVEHWDEMTALFEAKSYSELYELMCQLRKE